MDVADGRLIPELIAAIQNGRPMPLHSDGSQTRSMTFVDDAISLLRIVMEHPMSRLLPINIGSDDERSVEEIARSSTPAPRSGPRQKSGLVPVDVAGRRIAHHVPLVQPRPVGVCLT
jgi:dTDP-glucose 4,6-dehydratase